MTIARRLRLFRRRATRWFQPPVRAAAGADLESDRHESGSPFDGGAKPPFSSH